MSVIELTKSQADVVARLRALPGSDTIVVKAQDNYFRPGHVRTTDVTITGGYLLERLLGDECETCGHVSRADTSRRDRIILRWRNGRYVEDGSRWRRGLEARLSHLEKQVARAIADGFTA